MFVQGLLRLTGTDSVTAAWRSLVSTQDVVGIKVFSSPGRNSGTRAVVVAKAIETLLQAGIPASQIVIWDKRLGELRLAGYYELAEKYGVQIAGSHDEGYDPEVFYETALLGRLVFGDLEFGRKGDGIGRKSYVSKLVTKRITKIVNITPMLNHNLAGVSGVLYGLTMGSVDNVIRFEQDDPQRLASAIPEIYAMREIGDKVVLNVVDALIGQYQGEENTLLHYSTPLNQLWFSRDPVALDVLAIAELQRQRKLAKNPEAKVIEDIYTNAGILDLGIANIKKITTERLKVE